MGNQVQELEKGVVANRCVISGTRGMKSELEELRSGSFGRY